MSLYLCNAFSLNMLSPREVEGPSGETLTFPTPYVVDFRPIAASAATDMLKNPWSAGGRAHGKDVVMAIGHPDTAAVVGGILGMEIPANRATVQVVPGDCVIITQYRGPRLPEGATTLPEGASIEFWLAVVRAIDDRV